MNGYSHVVLVGNLTQDPELRSLPSGTSVGSLRMAISESYRTKEGEQRDEVCYVDVEVWGRQAETANQYLTKGSPVMIEGRLRLDQWEQDGQKRSKLKVKGEKVQFLPKRDGGAPAPKAPPPAPTAPPMPEKPQDDWDDEPPF